MTGLWAGGRFPYDPRVRRASLGLFALAAALIAAAGASLALDAPGLGLRLLGCAALAFAAGMLVAAAGLAAVSRRHYARTGRHLVPERRGAREIDGIADVVIAVAALVGPAFFLIVLGLRLL
jgi:hypothetical protein